MVGAAGRDCRDLQGRVVLAVAPCELCAVFSTWSFDPSLALERWNHCIPESNTWAHPVHAPGSAGIPGEHIRVQVAGGTACPPASGLCDVSLAEGQACPCCLTLCHLLTLQSQLCRLHCALLQSGMKPWLLPAALSRRHLRALPVRG